MKCENCYGILIIWMQWNLYIKKTQPQNNNPKPGEWYLFLETAAGFDEKSWLRIFENLFYC